MNNETKSTDTLVMESLSFTNVVEFLRYIWKGSYGVEVRTDNKLGKIVYSGWRYTIRIYVPSDILELCLLKKFICPHSYSPGGTASYYRLTLWATNFLKTQQT